MVALDEQRATALINGETQGDDVSQRYVNRELSWLQFNRRVLHEALDERTPLLERVMFLSIFNSNLDEYYQKRVGGLKRQIAAGVLARSIDGMTPHQQLLAIRHDVLQMLQVQARAFEQDIRPALARHNIHLLEWEQLTEAEHQFADRYFHRNLFSVLTPLAVDPGHPFPFISNLSTSLGVMLSYPSDHPDAGVKQFARVKVPKVLPRWVRLLPEPTSADHSGGFSGGGGGAEDGPFRFVHVVQIIRNNLEDLFAGMIVNEAEPFRITRNADVERDQEDAEDLLDLIEQELRDRRFADVIRLEIKDKHTLEMLPFLTEELHLDATDIYRMSGQLDYTDLLCVHALNLPQLKHEPWSGVMPPRLADNEADIFSVIRAGDVLVHHPYEFFSSSVERFIRAAANDPKVVAIKLTLYRTSEDSPFIPELIRAAEKGKQVVCLVELQARFDEERNISVAQLLEKAGVHVVYGMLGYKTHTKIAMVVRHEADGMRVYTHIGTGNYNSKTAQVYTDLGLFTCNEAITGEIVELFHILTGRSVKKDFARLLVAPTNMRRRFMEMIDREIAHCQQWLARGGDAQDPNRPRIIAKMNSLEDSHVCEKLYEASAAGVKIDLIVRGFCCLRPGVAGMSENIRVMSVIGRFLEHSRIYYFRNAGNSEYYIGSADWMYRNLNNRVECITPIEGPGLQQRLWQILDIMLNDHRSAWDMQPDGSYVQRKPDPDRPEQALGTHRALMELHRREAQAALPAK